VLEHDDRRRRLPQPPDDRDVLTLISLASQAWNTTSCADTLRGTRPQSDSHRTGAASSRIGKR
jgi:hypothetical protein